ncbi:EPIDERMAL PATTERNING FACTOR-like protein 5 isoform X2 [Lotus japonicus]|uniref:EPIDERMAL PATTERNING FACTOR-like protein 5 isoform X2 n=1 Tax=Lotus japonicus TaxID=34305 RepID=UPI002589ED02|nr:EPIDERMAL PATTERNING FACTOR-like protein 5 isoform X2 [Lotus japonicus]
MEKKRNTNKLCCRVFFFFLFTLSICTLIFSSATVSPITGLETRCPMFFKAGIDFQGKTEVSMGWARRLLGGPGSFPPRCAAKCGRCAPCRPVHVPVPPGNPVTAEYYPEAWRCKCGNRLYMP